MPFAQPTPRIDHITAPPPRTTVTRTRKSPPKGPPQNQKCLGASHVKGRDLSGPGRLAGGKIYKSGGLAINEGGWGTGPGHRHSRHMLP